MVNRPQPLPGADLDLSAVKAALSPYWRNGRRQNLWYDEDVLRLAIIRHREVMIEQLRAEATQLFGVERTPSKSATNRFWMFLDLVRPDMPWLKTSPPPPFSLGGS